MRATSGGARSYRDLVAWQRVLALADRSLELADELPPRTQFSLGEQIRRAAVSVPANIAEGQGRRTPGDFARHLRIAHGSLMELETHLILVGRRGYADRARVTGAIEEARAVGRLLGALIRSIPTRAPLGRAEGRQPGG